MKKILFLLLISCSHPPPPQTVKVEPPTRSLADQHRAAVVIEHLCQTTGFGIETDSVGSGVILSDRRVLTATHVVANDKCVYAALDMERHRHLLTIVQSSKELDVTLLSAEPGFGNLATPVTLGSPPKPGERACVVTFLPHTTRHCGDVLVFRGEEGKGADLIWNGIVEFGNSGSGVYDDQGHLVAIATNTQMCVNGQFCMGMGTSLERVPWAKP